MRRKHHLADRLRDQIVSALHLGSLREGDRLPSIRQAAAAMGENARAVARAYRVLEAERLVEVRDRSGIYAAPQPHVGGAVLQETARWAARVVVDGWKRGIAVAETAEFFRRCTTRRRVRCAFVETSEDTAAAFTHDLREDLGMDTATVWLRSLPRLDAATGLPRDPAPPALAAADLVVTTAYHAREVGPVAAALAKPLVVASVNEEMVGAVERKLRGGGLTVICADPAFGERIRVQYQELVTPDSPLRVVSADDRIAVGALDRAEPVLVTRAARQRLGKVHLPLVYPHSPTISSGSALEIVEFLVRYNLEGQAAETGASR